MRFLIIVIFISSGLTSYSQQDYISWSKYKKIEWSAFKAKPDNTRPYAAMSAVGIYYKYHATINGKSVKVRFQMDTRFDKLKSWSRLHQQTDYMLKHEQIHFDICELIKRKFKKEAESTVYTTNYRNEIEEMFNKYSDWIHQLQQKYDEQTGHSGNKMKQKSWENLIQHELLK
ncbi:MAG: hypothetical protein JWQ96_3 [Segetibacter sp.]|nr:hypothetical protein [Segetibacter sp.]